jgi:2-polyprenyl-3-methyl-5-hydroxy-6-metoxy-1,4-benzoquinol methylase
MPIKKNREHVVSGYEATAEEFAVDAKRDLKINEPTREKFLSLLPNNEIVLEIGCGAGWESKWFADQGLKVLAVDPAGKLIKLAQADDHGVDFRTGTVEDVKETDGLFDGIWCSRVFHHLHSEERPHFIGNAAELLKPAGILYLNARITELETDTPTMVHFIPRYDISEQGLLEMAAEAGLVLVESRAWEKAPPWKEFLFKKAG